MTLQQLYAETEEDMKDDLMTTNSKIPYLYDKYLKLVVEKNVAV